MHLVILKFHFINRTTSMKYQTGKGDDRRKNSLKVFFKYSYNLRVAVLYITSIDNVNNTVMSIDLLWLICSRHFKIIWLWTEAIKPFWQELTSPNLDSRDIQKPYFPAFGLNMERYWVSLRIQSECGKIRTKKTPNTDTFTAQW